MIYLNKNQIIGLNEYVSEIRSNLENLTDSNYVSITGGIITGNITSNSNLILNSGILVSGNYFYINLNSGAENKILIGDYSNNQIESGSFIKINSIYETDGENNRSGIFILESESGNINIYLGDSGKLIFNTGLNIFSKNKFSISNYQTESIYVDTGSTILNKDIRLSNFKSKDVKTILQAGSGNIAILDNFDINSFYLKKYNLYIYTRDSVQIKNLQIFNETGKIIILEDQTQNFNELNYISFTGELDYTIASIKVTNAIDKKIIIKGNSLEYYK